MFTGFVNHVANDIESFRSSEFQSGVFSFGFRTALVTSFLCCFLLSVLARFT